MLGIATDNPDRSTTAGDGIGHERSMSLSHLIVLNKKVISK